MNKTQLIDAMAADAGISKAAAKKALESFLGNVFSIFVQVGVREWVARFLELFS